MTKWLGYYNPDVEQSMGSDVYTTSDGKTVIATDVVRESGQPPVEPGTVCVGEVAPIPVARHRSAACGNDLNKYF